MSKQQAKDAKDQPAPEAGFLSPACPYAGHGGSYVINPETNVRELVERTEEKGANHGD